jgi:hypothetical protein
MTLLRPAARRVLSVPHTSSTFRPRKGPTVPHFQLRTADGESLGVVALSRPDWPPGSVIYRGRDDPNLRVLEILVLDEPELLDVLVVEPA